MISFDGPTKRIFVTGVSTQEVREIYSEWKNWVLQNPQWLPAFRTFGGDETVSGQFAPAYYFLAHGWRVVVDAEQIIFGTNLYTNEGDNPVITLNGAVATLNNSDVGQVAVGEGGAVGGVDIDYAQIAEAVWSYNRDV